MKAIPRDPESRQVVDRYIKSFEVLLRLLDADAIARIVKYFEEVR